MVARFRAGVSGDGYWGWFSGVPGSDRHRFQRRRKTEFALGWGDQGECCVSSPASACPSCLHLPGGDDGSRRFAPTESADRRGRRAPPTDA